MHHSLIVPKPRFSFSFPLLFVSISYLTQHHRFGSIRTFPIDFHACDLTSNVEITPIGTCLGNSTLPMASQPGIEHAPLPTVIDHVEGQGINPPNMDVENRERPINDESAVQSSHSHIDLNVERAVVRKLDWRVPTLLGVLCRFFRLFWSLMILLKRSSVDLLAFLDRSNIGYETSLL